MLELNIKERGSKDSLNAIRATGSVPAVFYGPKEESTSISVDAAEFLSVWKTAGGSAIISLKGIGEDKEALIHDVSVHPVNGSVQHIDFYVIERGKKLNVTVPLEYIGEAPAEKENGIVVKILHEVDMEVKPSDIPAFIEVDLTKLVDLSSTITVGDLQIPESAELALELTEPVASISEAKDEPEPEEEERTIDDVEIEEKGKKEDGEDGEKEGE